MGPAIFLWVICAPLASVVAQDTLDVAVDGELTLKLKSPPPEITRVVWKHGVNLVTERTRGKLTYYDPFKTCATLNDDSSLFLKNIQQIHAGVYSVELNNKVQTERFSVRVFHKVPRPVIRITPLTCSHTSDSCTLVCEVDTTGVDPVSYVWLFETEESDETARELMIQPGKDTPPTYTCRVKNPVSEADSEPLKNPLIPPPPPLVVIWYEWLLLVSGILLLILILLYVAYRKRRCIMDKCGKCRDQVRRNTPNNNRPAATQPAVSQPLRNATPEAPTGEKTVPTDKANDTPL